MAIKLPIKFIEIERSEGPETDKGVLSFPSWETVEEKIMGWSLTAPKTPKTSHICPFRIVFVDDQFLCGNYELFHYELLTQPNAKLGFRDQVRRSCRFLAGLEKPHFMDDQAWAASIHQNSDKAPVVRQYLENYDI